MVGGGYANVNVNVNGTNYGNGSGNGGGAGNATGIASGGNTSRPASSTGTGSSVGSPSPMFFHADDARSSLSSMQDDGGGIGGLAAAVGGGGPTSCPTGLAAPKLSSMSSQSSFFRADDARSVLSGTSTGNNNNSATAEGGGNRPRLPSGTINHRPSPLLPTSSLSSLSAFVTADGKSVPSSSSSGFFRADGSLLEDDNEENDTRNPIASPRIGGGGSVVGGSSNRLNVDNSDTLSGVSMHSIGSSARLGLPPHIAPHHTHHLSQHLHHHPPYHHHGQHHPNGISPMVPIHAKSASIDTAVASVTSPSSPSPVTTANSTANGSGTPTRGVRFHGRTSSISSPHNLVMPTVVPHSASPLSPSTGTGPGSPTPLSPTTSAKGFFDAPRTPRSVRVGSTGDVQQNVLARIASNSSVGANTTGTTGEEKDDRDREKEKAKPKSHLERMNELARASREQRKVLDLEISNNSLLAINRALERKLRRQNAEIRRFRRLSRSGNLSKIADSFEMRRGKKRHEKGENGESDSDGDESQDDDDYDSEGLSSSSTEEDYTDSNSEGSEHSDTSRRHRRHHRGHGSDVDDEDDVASSTALKTGSPSSSSRAQKDTHRLMHDLSKHQQLLVSSQKLDDSIKRCLGRAESLLEEAKRSLEYSVGPSEVRGRVLNSDEVGGIAAGGKGLLSSLVDINDEEEVDVDDNETEAEVDIETDVSVMG